MLTDNNVTRFPNGLNNQPNGVGDIFNSLKWPDWVGVAHRFEEDFYNFTAGQWTLTNVAGAGTWARTDGNGGLAVLTTDVNDDDSSSIQRVAAGLTGESWRFDPTKKFYMDLLFTPSNVALITMLIGFGITDTTIIAGWTDNFSFRVAEGSGDVLVVAEKNDVEVASASAIGTLTAAVQNRLSMFFDGNGTTDGRLYAALNGNIGGYIVPGASFPDDEDLTFSLALASRSAAAKSVTLDRIFVAQQI